MPSIVTDNFRVFAAQQFIESLEEPYTSVSTVNGVPVGIPDSDDTSAAAQAFRSKIYLFIGRSYFWNDINQVGISSDGVSERYDGVSTVNDNNPPDPVDCTDEISEIYDDMIAIKRVTRADVSQVVRKRLWQSNTVYDMYRHDYGVTSGGQTKLSSTGQSKLYDSQFYVMNSNFQVYKCIYNGELPDTGKLNGIASTVEPTGTSTSIITTSDGYKWKYMYTLNISDYIKFVSTDFIPVKEDSTVKDASIDGSINQVVIKNRGQSITPGTYYTPIIGDGGLGVDATKAIVRIVVPSTGTLSGKISTAELQQFGSGYTYGKIDLNECYTTLADALSRNQSADVSLGATPGSLEVIISPPGGHGFDVFYELGAYRVMINKSLDFLDGNGDLPVDMQFRRFGLISDPQTNSGDDFVSTTAAVCKAMKFPSTMTDNFENGEIITQSTTGAKGRVIHWDSQTKILRYYQNEYISNTQSSTNTGKFVEFSGNNTISTNRASNNITAIAPDTTFTNTVSGIEFTSGYSSGEVKKYSGKILYVENRKPVFRSNDQIEDVKLVIEF